MKRQPWLTVVSLLLVAVGCSNPVDTESEQAVLLQLDREKPDMVMRVRFKSDLTLDQVKEIAEKRAPEFEALASQESLGPSGDKMARACFELLAAGNLRLLRE